MLRIELLLLLPSFGSCGGVMGSGICGALLNRLRPGSLYDAFALGMAFVGQGPSSRVLQPERTSCPGRRSGGCTQEVTTTTTTTTWKLSPLHPKITGNCKIVPKQVPGGSPNAETNCKNGYLSLGVPIGCPLRAQDHQNGIPDTNKGASRCQTIFLGKGE